jgi:hypothetical protein
MDASANDPTTLLFKDILRLETNEHYQLPLSLKTRLENLNLQIKAML